MKTFENITELSTNELLKIDGGYEVPSGSASYDAVYAISYAVGFASDCLKLSMSISGSLFGRSW
jgi:hypothetical protein